MLTFVRVLRGVSAAGVLLTMVACTSVPTDDRWGERAGRDVSWHRTLDAASEAAKSPSVWLPLIGAATLQVDHFDHRISDWAVSHTPLYGSTDHASKASDDLQEVAALGTFASWLAIPSDGDWNAKLRGGGIELGALAADGLFTEAVKKAANRTRPNGGTDSMPSGHTSFATGADWFTIANLEAAPLDPTVRTAFTIGADAITAATAWGRVEAGAHYPSDVLVGMAIGNFFGRFFSNAFLRESKADRVSLSFAPTRDGPELTWNVRF